MIKKLYLTIILFSCAGLIAVAQIGATKNIGQAANWVHSIKGALIAADNRNDATVFYLPTPYGTDLPVTINRKSDEDGTITIAGKNSHKEVFSLSADSNGKVTGYYHSIKERKAYRYQTDATGNVIAKEVAIETLLCMDYTPAALIPSDEAEAAKTPARTTAIPKYNSKPDSKYIIYIDLDGEQSSSSWGNINAKPIQSWTDAQVFEIWQVSAQDFLPWDINVTTDRAMYNAQPTSRRMMCIVTSTLDAADGQAIGGIAHIGSFGSGSFDPCWVFNKGVKKTGETVSHEVGHTLGLTHDGYNNSTYYQGHNAWAPIMGAAYSTKTVTIDDANWLGQWSRGEYSGANNSQNDVSVIGNYNGFRIRPDEHGNKPDANATDLAIEADGSILGEKNRGIIHNAADLDVFKFTLSSTSSLDLLAVPHYSPELNRFPNLNIKARLLNEQGTALLTVDSLPPTAKNTWDAMSAALRIMDLAAGTYYIEIDGTKQGSSGSVGYTDYSSIGGFSISGNITESVGIREDGNISQFNIYPNPTTGVLSLTFNAPAKSNYKLAVINTMGQIVHEEVLTGFSGAYANQLNMAQYGKGVFMINLSDAESSATRRIVVY